MPLRPGEGDGGVAEGQRQGAELVSVCGALHWQPLKGAGVIALVVAIHRQQAPAITEAQCEKKVDVFVLLLPKQALQRVAHRAHAEGAIGPRRVPWPEAAAVAGDVQQMRTSCKHHAINGNPLQQPISVHLARCSPTAIIVSPGVGAAVALAAAPVRGADLIEARQPTRGAALRRVEAEVLASSTLSARQTRENNSANRRIQHGSDRLRRRAYVQVDEEVTLGPQVAMQRHNPDLTSVLAPDLLHAQALAARQQQRPPAHGL
mmetsp:Transcript_7553/g.27720  ORF Transcript_7553/g.27720 Transcript_7553/m.27720 type:complete len:262 (+) Transcript_7553:1017-1802(+)